ncbi:MAG: GNAT family N-acetyltransferase [Rhodospirillales bacterium]
MEPLLFKSLQVRLAETSAEVEAAQRLRYRVFYEEMAAKPSPAMRAKRLDFDDFDPICEHLLVVDLEGSNGAPAVVGTYRLLRRDVAMRHGGFYSEQEYDLSALLAFPGGIVEVGRSCVDPAYRARGVMQMLWRGFAAYVHHHDLSILFGCASFPGTEPRQMEAQLSYLYHYHLAPRTLRPRALAQHYVDMDMLPPTGLDPQSILNELPPLIKGYLRLGGFVGDGAVVDPQFNTTDVCVLVKTDQLTEKYDRRYRQSPPEKGARDH